MATRCESTHQSPDGRRTLHCGRRLDHVNHLCVDYDAPSPAQELVAWDPQGNLLPYREGDKLA
jgi:hypothetical protein